THSMNSPQFFYALRWLIHDTVRQARSSAVFWLMLGVSAIAILGCLSIGVQGAVPLKHGVDLPEFLPRGARVDREKAAHSGVDVVGGELTIGFGLVHIELGRDAEDAVRFVQLLLVGGVADTAGILFALLWTAGFLPSFLEAGSLSVLLAKPVPRGLLLFGKFLGVLLFVVAQMSIFVVGTWLALGIRTGVWNPLYLMSIPVLLLHFAVFFSFSALLAALTRSTLLCMLGTLAFWFVCWSVNFGYLSALAQDHESMAAGQQFVMLSYLILPKPANLNFMLQELVQSAGFFRRVPELANLRWETIGPIGTVMTSLLFIGVVLTLAGRRLRMADY
ncbi:MAG: ABC transporter permease subunit, partial [Candidatus Acidiferrum sp.]